MSAAHRRLKKVHLPRHHGAAPVPAGGCWSCDTHRLWKPQQPASWLCSGPRCRESSQPSHDPSPQLCLGVQTCFRPEDKGYLFICSSVAFWSWKCSSGLQGVQFPSIFTETSLQPPGALTVGRYEACSHFSGSAGQAPCPLSISAPTPPSDTKESH